MTFRSHPNQLTSNDTKQKKVTINNKLSGAKHYKEKDRQHRHSDDLQLW